jgi:hypothetical protein
MTNKRDYMAAVIQKQVGVWTLMAIGARGHTYLEEMRGGLELVVLDGRHRLRIVLNHLDYWNVSLIRLKRITREEVIVEARENIPAESLSEVVYKITHRK